MGRGFEPSVTSVKGSCADHYTNPPDMFGGRYGIRIRVSSVTGTHPWPLDEPSAYELGYGDRA